VYNAISPSGGPESYANNFPAKRLKISLEDGPEFFGGSNLAPGGFNQVDNFHGKQFSRKLRKIHVGVELADV
jgi:hypothetical protein